MEKRKEEEKRGSELGQVTQVAATVPAANPGQHHLQSCAPGLADAIANFSTQTLPLQNTQLLRLFSVTANTRAPVSYLLLLLLKYSLCCEHKEWERFVLFIGSSGICMHHPPH